nr:hypothetical protein GCM10017611_31530 [Rhodococcus wratislaviensis]
MPTSPNVSAGLSRAAMGGDPLFGTVEVTIEELAELLNRHIPPSDQDAARAEGASRVSCGAL